MSSELTIFDSFPEELKQKILSASKEIEQNCSMSLSKIRLDAKNFILPDGENTETSEFTGVIVNYIHANVHYPKEYEDGVINPPDCFALGKEPCDKLKPSSIVEARHCVECATCSKFQWGSAAKGKGKACSEHTLLAVYIPALGEDLLLLEEKKANSKACDAYLNTVIKKHGHPIMVYTSFKMAEKSKWAQTFYAVDRVPNEMVATLANRIDDANEMLVSRVESMYKRSMHTDIPFEGSDRAPREAA